MANIYIMSVSGICLLFASLVCSVVSLFSYKQKVATIRKEIARLDRSISDEGKKNMILEVDYTLEHTSTRVQKMADQLLASRFTNVKQLMAVEELPVYNTLSK